MAPMPSSFPPIRLFMTRAMPCSSFARPRLLAYVGTSSLAVLHLARLCTGPDIVVVRGRRDAHNVDLVRRRLLPAPNLAVLAQEVVRVVRIAPAALRAAKDREG